MPPDIKRNILANMNVKLYLMNIYISLGSAATYLRGDDSFNSNFLHRSIMNLMVKNIKIGPRLSKLYRVKVGRELLTRSNVLFKWLAQLINILSFLVMRPCFAFKIVYCCILSCCSLNKFFLRQQLVNACNKRSTGDQVTLGT